MGYESIMFVIAGVAVGSLVFYIAQFIVEVIQGKYRTDYKGK